VAALQVGADGRLYAAEPALKQIVVYGADGEAKVAARDVMAWDIAATKAGTIYFLDDVSKTIGEVAADGSSRIVYNGGEIAKPGGIALSPDQAMVIVTDAVGRFAWSFQIAADGSLENGEPFYRLEMPENTWESNAKGVAMDAGGAAYFATPGRIQICEASGRVIEILNAPEPGPGADELTGIAFAGAGPTWIYAVEAGKLYRRPVKVAYAPVWAPVKPPKPLL
jgi:sugar lactone lactonase YvrE